MSSSDRAPSVAFSVLSTSVSLVHWATTPTPDGTSDGTSDTSPVLRLVLWLCSVLRGASRIVRSRMTSLHPATSPILTSPRPRANKRPSERSGRAPRRTSRLRRLFSDQVLLVVSPGSVSVSCGFRNSAHANSQPGRARHSRLLQLQALEPAVGPTNRFGRDCRSACSERSGGVSYLFL